MKSKNFNIFAGDRSYKTNFVLQFKSPRIERRFREEAFLRTRYSLRGFLIFSLAALSLHFMTSDCFTYGVTCDHPHMIYLAMTALIGALGGLLFKIKHFFVQILVAVSLVYFQIIFLEMYAYHTSLILITLYTSLASFLIQQVWFLQLINNLLTYGLFIAYAYFTSNQELFKKSPPEFLIDLSIYNLIVTTLLAFLEKGRKERWVLVETFKKSDKIFRQLYEEVPYAFFVIDKSKRILYSSQHGLALLSAFFRNCISCNFSRVNVNLQDIIEPDYLPQVDGVFANASALNLGEEPANCFVVLKSPSEEYDPTKCRFSLDKENLYKFKAIQTLWKTQYAYMVVLKDYSTKKKSEKITSKTVNYLTKQLHQMIEQYDQNPDKTQMKFKSMILSKMMKIKFAAYNSLLIFHRIFAKSEGLKDKKTFNIRSAILSSIGVLSFKSKEKKCDLQLKFEHGSFPTEIFADKYLFQQTFSNSLQMLLENLTNTTITIDCKLASITPEGQYILSFEFKFPRNPKLTYELLSSKIQAASPVSLDHVLKEDSLSFFLALIVPTMDVFHGKIYAEDNDYRNEVILCLELLFDASGNSKAKVHPEWSTFKNMNYNATGNPNKDLFFWKHEEPPENSHEIEQANQPAENNVVANKSKEQQPIDTKPAFQPKLIEDLNSKLMVKSTNSDQGIRNRMDEKKIRDELQKLSMKGMKNFGSQEDVPPVLGTSSALGSSRLKKEITIEDAKKSGVLEINEEEKTDDVEPVLVSSSNLRGLSMNGFQGELAYDRITSAESSTSIPDIDSFGKTQPALRIHQYTLKLAITKALMEIIDDQTKDKLKKSDTENSDLVSTLESVTVEERLEGFEIKESELCEKTLRHLSAKLVNQRRCDDFMQFAGRYVSEFEDEIEKLQPMIELEQTISDRRDAYGSDAAEIGSVQARPRKLESLGRKESSMKLFLKKQSRDSSFVKETERSKEKILNERFLMSPAINKTMTLRSALSLTAKSAESEAFAFLQSPKVAAASMQKSINSIPPRPAENEGPISLVQTDLFSRLVPFGIDEHHLPHHLLARAMNHQRRWIGAPNKIESNTPERMFIYNEIFTILAVDDSAFVFKGLEHLPVKYRMKFEFAKNGTEALKKYLSNINQGILYHFILLDLQMPVMDGFETARVIRAEEVNKNYPATYICAMSAFEDPETINRTRKEGMDNFCQKPLRSEVLNNLIKSRCEMIGIKAVEN